MTRYHKLIKAIIKNATSKYDNSNKDEYKLDEFLTNIQKQKQNFKPCELEDVLTDEEN
ncbi:4759_t:CDS:2 [Funneliformis mosseae]|uniref:4759_t:CDS:1 n=1 Tax=Funneliformis mosseae TaxID=27381 RepID=A0A9N9CC59_FUNMO|nr:4759_t:CDS:2 [Funneliformis mosseae]